MSFNNPYTKLDFSASNNGHNYDTYQTDFKTGRSWIHPQPWLRFYKDGGVSLHGTGYRQPYIRQETARMGIDLQTFGELRGTLTTPCGEKVPRSTLRTPPNTVLVEGDRVYPLSHSQGSKSPQDRLPPAQILNSPLAVWQDRSMMPVCPATYLIHVPSKDAHDKWMDEHGDTLKVARTLGALLGSNFAAHAHDSKVRELLRRLNKHSAFSDYENAVLFKADKAMLTKAVMHMTANKQEYEYLLLTPS